MLSLIDRLEALVNAGTRVPLTSKALIDEQEFLELVDQLRVGVPDEFRHAKRVSHDRDRVISQAQLEADKLLSLAREHAEQMVQDSDIVRSAQQRAAELLSEATAEARGMRAEADEYAMEVLEGLEKELNRLLASVRKGKAALENISRDNDPSHDDDLVGSPGRGPRPDGKHTSET